MLVCELDDCCLSMLMLMLPVHAHAACRCLQAVKLMSQMAARLPDLVQLLQPNFDDTAALDIRRGCAQSLELALLADTAAGDPQEAPGAASGAGAAAAFDSVSSAKGIASVSHLF